MGTSRQNLALRIFHGVPSFAGEAFRATKIPIILMVVLIFAATIISYPILLVASRRHHWPRPDLMARLGFLASQRPEIQASYPPKVTEYIHNMSQQELSWAKGIYNTVTMESLVIFVLMCWWMISFARFLLRRKSRNPA